MQGAKLRYAAAAIVLAAVVGQTAARPPVPDGEGGGGPKPNVNHQRCLQSAVGSLTHTPATPIGPFERATVSWSVRLPQNCLVFGHSLYLNDAPIGGTGSMPVQPTSNTRYALKLVIGGLTRQWFTTVEVKMPQTVRIKGNTAEWRNILIQALGIPNTTVILAHDVDMDLTFHKGIFIAQGVTLTSEAQSVVVGDASLQVPVVQGPPARDARHRGPRLYTTSRPRPLFEMRCDDKLFFSDNVRINGFRLHGPNVGSKDGSESVERGIMVISCSNVEIANMELAGWSGQAIYVNNPEGRFPDRNTYHVSIHDNYFHHNQQESGGEGYGIEVKQGAHVLIERNVFDFNRHGIAAGGEPGTRYTANLNLFLKGGGTHCWDNPGPNAGICWFTHQVDVHGTKHCGISGHFSEQQYNCGPAGEFFAVTYNAFQYSAGYAFKLRGTPTAGAYMGNNVFAHSSEDGAFHQNESGLSIGRGPNANTLGVDSSGKYGVCDFDGDGRDDLFLATGVSWWYSSAGRMNWVYLNSHTELLHQVGLGDFDGDGRCDVFAVNRAAKQWEISSGGSRPWTPLPGTYDFPFKELAFGDFNGDGVTDVFRRAPDGQWSAISPGIYDWKALQSSSFPLNELRFGHFTNDRVTDVIAVQGGRWSVSRSGTGEWEELNPELSDELKPSLMIGDIDADGIDDIVRYLSSEDGLTGTWQVSWGGRTGWVPLSTLSLVATKDPTDDPHPAKSVRSFVGRFNPWAGAANVLAIDNERKGHIYIHAKAGAGFSPHSLYAY